MFENTRFSRWYTYLFTDLADPRTNNWFLIRDPGPLLLILLTWVYFVLKLGPSLMAKRKPFTLQKVLVGYNAIQVVISFILAYLGCYYGYFFGNYSFTCEPVDRSRSPDALKIARLIHYYFLAKLTELLDTVFFVLRKKDNQVSFLHVYHHAGMPIIAWFLTKYFPGGHVVFSGLLNCMVHVVMYTYYMISAMGPQYQKYLWWKKYITSMQLAQFAAAGIHMSQILWIDCGFPKWIICFGLPNAAVFYMLFSDFYKKAYKNSQDKAAAAAKKLNEKSAGDTKKVQ